MTKQVTLSFSLSPTSPLEPFPSSIPFHPLPPHGHASLSHLCLHASSSSRCIPELLNDAGISRGWQRLSSFKPFKLEPFGRRILRKEKKKKEKNKKTTEQIFLLSANRDRYDVTIDRFEIKYRIRYFFARGKEAKGRTKERESIEIINNNRRMKGRGRLEKSLEV